MSLRHPQVPKTAENFRQLCTGEHEGPKEQYVDCQSVTVGDKCKPQLFFKVVTVVVSLSTCLFSFPMVSEGLMTQKSVLQV